MAKSFFWKRTGVTNATLSCLVATVVSAVPSAAQTPANLFLMPDRQAEIAMARSAAPETISRDATVLVLTRHGYEVAVKGTNGFVCMVERAWVGAVDTPEFWNSKIRGPDCLNAAAARFVLPLMYKRSAMVMAGQSKAEMIDALLAALAKNEFPRLEPGAMGYMMSKGAYLTDKGDHNGSHLMFWVSQTDSAAWGDGMPLSPVMSAGYWTMSGDPRLKRAPPVRVFVVSLGRWSDGTSSAKPDQ
jgi:hypothetical protein